VLLQVDDNPALVSSLACPGRRTEVLQRPDHSFRGRRWLTERHHLRQENRL